MNVKQIYVFGLACVFWMWGTLGFAFATPRSESVLQLTSTPISTSLGGRGDTAGRHPRDRRARASLGRNHGFLRSDRSDGLIPGARPAEFREQIYRSTSSPQHFIF